MHPRRLVRLVADSASAMICGALALLLLAGWRLASWLDRDRDLWTVLVAVACMGSPAAAQWYGGGCANGSCGQGWGQSMPYGPSPGVAVTPPRVTPIVAVGQELARAIVRVVSHDADGDSLGTGTVVCASGKTLCIVTAWHVVEGGRSHEVRTSDGRRLQAELCARDEANDLAVLRVEHYGATPVALSDDARGMLTAAGYGGDGRLVAYRGPQIRTATAEGANAPSLVMRGEARGGDSGGPVLNASGALVGVLWGSARGETYAMFGAPVRAVIRSCCGAADTPPGPPTQEPSAPDGWERVDERLTALETAMARGGCSCEERWKAHGLRLVAVESRLDAMAKDQGKAMLAIAAVATQVQTLEQRIEAGGDAPPIDYDKLAAAVLDRLPPLKVETYSNGQRQQQTTVPVGGTLRLRFDERN